jgi:hypothetical protein
MDRLRSLKRSLHCGLVRAFSGRGVWWGVSGHRNTWHRLAAFLAGQIAISAPTACSMATGRHKQFVVEGSMVEGSTVER